MPKVCGAEAERCQCVRKPEHDPPHGCDCGGAWIGEYGTDTFAVVSYPDIGELLGWTVPAEAALAAAGLLAGGVRRGGIRYDVPVLPPCEVCGFSTWPAGGMHAARSIHMRGHERNGDLADA